MKQFFLSWVVLALAAVACAQSPYIIPDDLRSDLCTAEDLFIAKTVLLGDGMVCSNDVVLTLGTLVCPNSTTLPGTCTVGEVYMDTDASAGSRWCLCLTTDAWSCVGGGAAGNAFSTIGVAVADSSGDTLTVSDGTTIDFTTTDDPEDLTAEVILVDGTDAGAATTRTGGQDIQISRHDTDCTSLTDGVAGELCYEEDADTLFMCEPTSGGCDTAGEWISMGGAGMTSFDIDGDNNSPQTITNGNEALFVGGTAIDTTAAVTDQVTIDFDSTEINNTTWGDNLSGTIQWTFDPSSTNVYFNWSAGTFAMLASNVRVASGIPTFSLDDDTDTGLADAEFITNCPTTNDCDLDIMLDSGSDTEVSVLNFDTPDDGNTTTTFQNISTFTVTGPTADAGVVLPADSISTSEIDDASNTPVAGDVVIVDAATTQIDYITPHAGTDITADLEEEIHASEHNIGGDDLVDVDGTDAGASTTRTAEQKIAISRHDTDCTSLTDGVDGELCYEADDDCLYMCEPTSGGCDTVGEWISQCVSAGVWTHITDRVHPTTITDDVLVGGTTLALAKVQFDAATGGSIFNETSTGTGDLRWESDTDANGVFWDATGKGELCFLGACSLAAVEIEFDDNVALANGASLMWWDVASSNYAGWSAPALTVDRDCVWPANGPAVGDVIKATSTGCATEWAADAGGSACKFIVNRLTSDDTCATATNCVVDWNNEPTDTCAIFDITTDDRLEPTTDDFWNLCCTVAIDTTWKENAELWLDVNGVKVMLDRMDYHKDANTTLDLALHGCALAEVRGAAESDYAACVVSHSGSGTENISSVAGDTHFSGFVVP